MPRLISIAKKSLRSLLRPPLHRPNIKLPYVFLGTEYGGWPLLKSTPRGALIYSFGIGEDISFDLGAIEQFNCVVHGFDPTPRSRAWVDAQKLPNNFFFHPVGIGGKDEDAIFFLPANERHVSFSVAPALTNPAEAHVQAPIRKLETLIHELNTPEPNIVKMDIEGFEYEVIDNLFQSALRPQQLLIEFHHGLYGIEKDKTITAVDRLCSAGYHLFFVSSSGREYGFAL